MKKIIYFIIVIVIYCIIGNIGSEAFIIPNEAIRIRVVANSNSTYDQNIKIKVKNEMESYLYNLIKTDSIEEARNIINDNLNNIDKKIGKTLEVNNYKLNYDVNFGLNYFPSKEYKGIKYNEGYYESLLITLGTGNGDNWWCVLFPPLCLLEATENSNIEYTTIVKELFNKFN